LAIVFWSQQNDGFLAEQHHDRYVIVLKTFIVRSHRFRAENHRLGAQIGILVFSASFVSTRIE
jgi:hypothetical protein